MLREDHMVGLAGMGPIYAPARDADHCRQHRALRSGEANSGDAFQPVASHMVSDEQN